MPAALNKTEHCTRDKLLPRMIAFALIPHLSYPGTATFHPTT